MIICKKEIKNREEKNNTGSAGNRTQVTGIRNRCDRHYTTEPRNCDFHAIEKCLYDVKNANSEIMIIMVIIQLIGNLQIKM